MQSLVKLEKYLTEEINPQADYQFFLIYELLDGPKTFEEISKSYIKSFQNPEKSESEYLKIFMDAPKKTLLKHDLIKLDKNSVSLNLELRPKSLISTLRYLLNEYIYFYRDNGNIDNVDAFNGIYKTEKELRDFSQESNIPFNICKEIYESLTSKDERYKATVLQGPPGTGKTYTLLKLINFLKNSKTKEESFESQVSLVQFHPSYGYEEFIQGLKPLINDKAEGKSKSMSFEPVNGKLLNLIEDSEKIPRQINIKFPIQLKKEEKDYISYQFDEDDPFQGVHDGILLVMGLEKKPMHYKDIAEIMVKAGLYKPFYDDNKLKKTGYWGEIAINGFLSDKKDNAALEGKINRLGQGIYELTEEGLRISKQILIENDNKLPEIKWTDALTLSLLRLGGFGTNLEIYKELEKLNKNKIKSWQDVARRELQENCSDVKSWKGKKDLFQHINKGVWGLRTFENYQMFEPFTFEIIDELKKVMQLQKFYERERTPKMIEREESIEKITSLIEEKISINFNDLSVEGQKWGGSAAFVPWVRIFNNELSPTPKQGCYIVFLFDTEGKSFYLTIGIGTENLTTKQIKEESKNIREIIKNDIKNIDFINGETIDLVANGNTRATKYENGTVASIKYDFKDLDNIDGEDLAENVLVMIRLLKKINAFQGMTNDETLQSKNDYKEFLKLEEDQIKIFGYSHFLIMDEINRGNLPKIFGELLNLFEYRDFDMKLPNSEDSFMHVPANLYFLGSMNTADKAIRSIDYAMRRRMNFISVNPDSEVLRKYYESGINRNLVPNLYKGFDNLNKQIKNDLDNKDGYGIGHTYFMRNKDFDSIELENLWKRELYPLLEEYFFDNPETLEKYEIKNFWPDYEKTKTNLKENRTFTDETLNELIEESGLVAKEANKKINNWSSEQGLHFWFGNYNKESFATGGKVYSLKLNEKYFIFQVTGQAKLRFLFNDLFNRKYFSEKLDNKKRFTNEFDNFLTKHNLQLKSQNRIITDFTGQPSLELNDLTSDCIDDLLELLHKQIILYKKWEDDNNE